MFFQREESRGLFPWRREREKKIPRPLEKPLPTPDCVSQAETDLSMSLALSFDKAIANERLTVGDVANVAQENFSVVVEQCPETQELTASKVAEALASTGKTTIASDIGIVQTVRASIFCRLYSLCSNPSIAASNSFYLVR